MIGWMSSYAQLNNRVFEDRMAVEEADSGKFFAGLNALGFFKNNEYVRTIIDGYTLFGYQFQPFVSYHLNKNIRIDAADISRRILVIIPFLLPRRYFQSSGERRNTPSFSETSRKSESPAY